MQIRWLNLEIREYRFPRCLRPYDLALHVKTLIFSNLSRYVTRNSVKKMSGNNSVLSALKQTTKGRLKYDSEWFSEPGIQVVELSLRDYSLGDKVLKIFVVLCNK